jgi:hypothetical protein
MAAPIVTPLVVAMAFVLELNRLVVIWQQPVELTGKIGPRE